MHDPYVNNMIIHALQIVDKISQSMNRPSGIVECSITYSYKFLKGERLFLFIQAESIYPETYTTIGFFLTTQKLLLRVQIYRL